MARWRMVMGLALLVGGAVGIGLVITNSTAGSPIVSTMVLPGDARAVALDKRTKHTFVVDDPSQGTGATPGRVYVLDTRTGTVLRTVTVGRAPDFALVDERTGRVFVLNYGSGTVSVLNTDSGTVLRTTRVALGPNAAGVDEQTGRVFVSSLSPRGVHGLVQVLDARSGRLLGSVPVGAYPGVFAVDERTGHVFIVSNESTRMLDATSGRLLRIIPASGIGCPLGVSVNGPTSHVFIPMLMGMGVIDTRSGTVLRTIPMRSTTFNVRCTGPIPAGPIAVDTRSSRVFVGRFISLTPDTVTVLDAHNGRRLSMVPLGSTVLALAVDERAGRVFVVHGGAGGVSVLDAASGALQRNIDLGRIPRTVVVDAQARRAVVISGRGAIATPDAWGWVRPLLRRVIPFLCQPGPHTHNRSEQRDHTRHVPPVGWDDSGRACLVAFALARGVLRVTVVGFLEC